MEEIWKDIKGYEGLYQVSNLGNVKSLSRNSFNGKTLFKTKERVLKPIKAGTRESVNVDKLYFAVVLYKDLNRKQYLVHQLVAMDFLNHMTNCRKIVIDHKNGIRQDNRLENLQVITNRENTSKDKKNKSSKYTGVSWNTQSKKWVCGIYIDGKQYHLGRFKCELAAGLAYQNKLKEIR